MLVVVGGHSRNVGKTTAIEAILRATPGRDWWAFKITRHGHGLDSATPGFVVDEQVNRDGTDTGRYLSAGARRAFWVRTPQGLLAAAMPRLRGLFAEAPNVLAESNSLLDYIEPDLYISLVNFGAGGMKPSARRFLARADVLVVTGGGEAWPEVPGDWRTRPRVAISGLGAFIEDFLARPGSA